MVEVRSVVLRSAREFVGPPRCGLKVEIKSRVRFAWAQPKILANWRA